MAAGFALGLVVGGAIALRWRPRRPLVAAFAVILAAAPQLLLLAAHAPAPAVALAGVAGGAQAAIWGALWQTALQERVPAAAISRVAAWSSLLGLALAPPAYLAAGVVADAVGASAVLAAGACWMVASTLALLALPVLRAEPAVAAAAAAA